MGQGPFVSPWIIPMAQHSRGLAWGEMHVNACGVNHWNLLHNQCVFLQGGGKEGDCSREERMKRMDLTHLTESIDPF